MWERGIQLSEGGKGKKKAELFDLCKKAVAMKEIKLASYFSSAKDRKKRASKFSELKILNAWT